ncbi:MAG TPA: ribbon-helix-helix domain-containing protein [Verrucomicrobiae bacterium]|nr:ribbon-helix-helix domain-containing protein [Verrucomicrobiae bacterium]
MPNQRAKGQKLLTLPVSEDFIRDIDVNLPSMGYSNRSQFIRDAIIEKLVKAGITIPKGLALPPTRVSSGQKTKEEKFVDAVEAEADRRLARGAARSLPKLPPRPGAYRRSKKGIL